MRPRPVDTFSLLGLPSDTKANRAGKYYWRGSKVVAEAGAPVSAMHG